VGASLLAKGARGNILRQQAGSHQSDAATLTESIRKNR